MENYLKVDSFICPFPIYPFTHGDAFFVGVGCMCVKRQLGTEHFL
uniref:Uncharacterized protein n=1 Tax=Rhizophora mucronata TaxID=61149 RepID=A0A2P2P9C6_RHIMU